MQLPLPPVTRFSAYRVLLVFISLSLKPAFPFPTSSLVPYQYVAQKTLHRTPSIRSLQTVIPRRWKSEEKLFRYLYGNRRARNQIIKAAEEHHTSTGETVIYQHPLLQFAIFLHPGVDADYIQDYVEYQLSVYYPHYS